MGQTLYEKVFDSHTVGPPAVGAIPIVHGAALIHEVTSPQAFSMLEERKLKVLFPARTFATVDHIIPTASQLRPYQDALAEGMLRALEASVKKHGIRYFAPENGEQASCTWWGRRTASPSRA